MCEIFILSLPEGSGDSRLPHPVVCPVLPLSSTLITPGYLGWVQWGWLVMGDRLVMSARAGE